MRGVYVTKNIKFSTFRPDMRGFTVLMPKADQNSLRYNRLCCNESLLDINLPY